MENIIGYARKWRDVIFLYNSHIKNLYIILALILLSN